MNHYRNYSLLCECLEGGADLYFSICYAAGLGSEDELQLSLHALLPNFLIARKPQSLTRMPLPQLSDVVGTSTSAPHGDLVLELLPQNTAPMEGVVSERDWDTLTLSTWFQCLL
ncbi:Hypothetical predicted protein [Podarcis lilfordi]|uniref:Uncharacterized protein n=1 Tax=Podarcis lilfordi TaxID=74358 RepID=A0AA35LB93_9SAUR|nr:Hypothetical predicted protein [Podarcis lilfordi]